MKDRSSALRRGHLTYLLLTEKLRLIVLFLKQLPYRSVPPGTISPSCLIVLPTTSKISAVILT